MCGFEDVGGKAGWNFRPQQCHVKENSDSSELEWEEKEVDVNEDDEKSSCSTSVC